MNTLNLQKIRSAARREATGEIWRPFLQRWSSMGLNGNGNADLEDGEYVHRSQTEPVHHSTRDLANEEGVSPTTPAPANYGEDKELVMAGGRGRAEEGQSSEETVKNSETTGTTAASSIEKEGFGSKLRSRLHLGKKNKDDNPRSDNIEKPSRGKKLRHKKYTVGNQLKATLFNSWLNILLLAAPVGIALHFTSVDKKAVFVVNFIAIIPLAALLSYATEEISLRVGEVLGGLLNASFGNAVELIVSILALLQKEVVIVKTSLIGSILSNLLLVMGMCFFFGGLRRTEQFFNETVASTAASLLALAVASVIIPTAFDIMTTTTNVPIAEISRGTSVILLFVYGCYLYFQLNTHAEMFNAESKKVPMRPRKSHVPEGGVVKSLAMIGGIGAAPGRTRDAGGSREENDEIMNRNAFEEQKAEDDDIAEPELHIVVAVVLLAVSTAIVAVCAEWMVESIDDLTQTSSISAEFVGLILLPIVGNAAEHVTAVTVAVKDKMDLAIGVAVGSSMQIALLVIPFSVMLGWFIGNDDMNLSFDGFQVAILLVSVLLVNYVVGDGKSHWLEGVLLQCLYLIIAVTAWFYPQQSLEAES